MTMTAVIDLIVTIAVEERIDTIVDDIVEDPLLLVHAHLEDLIVATMILIAITNVVVVLVDIDNVVVTIDLTMAAIVNTIEETEGM